MKANLDRATNRWLLVLAERSLSVALLVLLFVALRPGERCALALESPEARWSVWRETFDPGSRARAGTTPNSGRWMWKPTLFAAMASRAEGQAVLAGDDGIRFGARASRASASESASSSSGVWSGVETGGALGLGADLAVDVVAFGQIRSDRAASGRLQELALRWSGSRYAASVGRSRVRWAPGQIGSLLAGRAAPPRWQLQAWTARPLTIPVVGTRWSGSVFLARLDDRDAVIPNALYFGQRLHWHPRDWLELSVARTILFGGDDRTSRLTARDFWNILTGTRENLPGHERSAGDSDQRASFSARASIPRVSRLWSSLERVEGFYEYAGEDMLHPPIPSAVAHHSGIAAWVRGWAASIEYLETVTGSNRWYSHIVYGREAYSYRGYPLGIPQGGDSRVHRWSLWTPAGSAQARLTRMRETFGEYSRNNEVRITWEAAGRVPLGARLVGEVLLARTRRDGPGIEPRAPGWFRDRVEVRFSYQPGLR